LRPIKPEDEPMWLEMFQNFSEESIRYRFFQIIKDTPHEVRVRYCNIDYDREMAIVAELTEDGRRKILGVVRVSGEPDGKAGEIAFIIADPWQGLGLGTKMVEFMLEICKDMGLETIYAIMLPDNARAINLMKKMGFTVKYLDDNTARATLNLKEEEKGKQPAEEQGVKETQAESPLARKEAETSKT
jgi:acetyltransferase